MDHWVHKLSKASERLQRQQCAAWKKRLTTRKGKPTRALFRWLKQGSRRGHYATKVGDVTHCGPAQYFDAHRQYWCELMNRDSAEAVAARCLAEAECPPLLETLPDDEIEALFGTLQSLKSWASGQSQISYFGGPLRWRGS